MVEGSSHFVFVIDSTRTWGYCHWCGHGSMFPIQSLSHSFFYCRFHGEKWSITFHRTRYPLVSSAAWHRTVAPRQRISSGNSFHRSYSLLYTIYVLTAIISLLLVKRTSQFCFTSIHIRRWTWTPLKKNKKTRWSIPTMKSVGFDLWNN